MYVCMYVCMYGWMDVCAVNRVAGGCSCPVLDLVLPCYALGATYAMHATFSVVLGAVVLASWVLSWLLMSVCMYVSSTRPSTMEPVNSSISEINMVHQVIVGGERVQVDCCTPSGVAPLK